jgi:hypothetical protein
MMRPSLAAAICLAVDGPGDAALRSAFLIQRGTGGRLVAARIF